MFLGRAVSVSEQVGLRPVLFSASEQVGMGPLLIMFLGTDWIMCRLPIIFQANSIKCNAVSVPEQKLIRFSWLCWCFTALRHILGHFGRGQLI